MQPISSQQLAAVVGGESFSQVVGAARAAGDVPAAQAYQSTLDFIAAHPFFHQGVMDLPIGGGKHFRNVPFVGPGKIAQGVLTGNGERVRAGIETTSATWAAP